MNGSTEQVARGEQVRSTAACTKAVATGPVAVNPGPCGPKTDRCAICEKVQPRQVECQNVGAVRLFFHKLELYGRESSVRPDALLCKNCCIGLVDGHRCVCWDLCWSI